VRQWTAQVGPAGEAGSLVDLPAAALVNSPLYAVRLEIRSVDSALVMVGEETFAARPAPRCCRFQPGSGRCGGGFIHANQIVLLRRKGDCILLQECLLRVQLVLGIAIEDLLLAYIVERGVDGAGRSFDV
jgi:hypothetical protein